MTLPPAAAALAAAYQQAHEACQQADVRRLGAKLALLQLLAGATEATLPDGRPIRVRREKFTADLVRLEIGARSTFGCVTEP